MDAVLQTSEIFPFRGSAETRARFSTPKRLSTVVRNLIEAWPDAVYRESLVEARVLGRKTVFVCAPDLIHELLVTQADALERDDFVLRALSPALGRGVLTADGDAWRHQRRMAAPSFRHDQVSSFVPAMSAAAARTRGRWLEGRHDVPFDILGEMMATTLDVIHATMLSADGAGDVTSFGQAMTDYLEQTTWKIALTFLGAPAWTPHPGSVRALRAAKYLRGVVAGIVARRRASGNSGTDLLGSMPDARDPETGAPMPDTVVIDNLLTFVAAGHETTALVMAWTFQLLAEYPEIEARVVAELACAHRRLDGETDLASLAYTRQVLMEVMRLYPPAPLLARRAARAVTLGNITIPAGRSIQVPVYAVHRHQALWAAPSTFDPGRFAPGATQQRPRYSYLPFGAGPRVCIGASFAMTECLALLAGLLPAFRFAPACPHGETIQDYGFDGQWFVLHITPTYDDTNSIGKVYFASYFRWVGKARELFFNSCMPDFDLGKTDFYVLTKSFAHEFCQEIQEFQPISVRVRIDRYNRKFVTIAHEFHSKTEGLIGRGEQSIMFVDKVHYRPLDIPAIILKRFLPYYTPNAPKTPVTVSGQAIADLGSPKTARAS